MAIDDRDLTPAVVESWRAVTLAGAACFGLAVGDMLVLWSIEAMKPENFYVFWPQLFAHTALAVAGIGFRRCWHAAPLIAYASFVCIMCFQLCHRTKWFFMATSDFSMVVIVRGHQHLNRLRHAAAGRLPE